MNTQAKVSALFLLVCVVVSTNGHGRLLEPPSRSSMFRFAYSDPMLIPYRDFIQPNYNDNQLYCGGREVQITNGGKCGVCGDSYSASVKENEAGGKYALGIITRNYLQGQTIDVTVEITAAHKGYFEFRLCPWNDVSTPITHECLNENLLAYENGGTTHYLPEDSSTAAGIYNLRVQLPRRIICTQCVLQWRYRTGNSWGVDEDGQSGLGHGPQEEFYGCSDVAIKASDEPLPSTTTSSTQSTTISTTASETIEAQTTTTRTKTTQPTKNPSEEETTTTFPTTTTTTITKSEEETSTKSTTQSSEVELYPDVDCSKVIIGQPIFRDCHSFFVCAYPQYDPFIFACPKGTVCDPTNGRCMHPWDVPYCNQS